MKKLLILLIFTYTFSLHSQCFTSISAGGVHVLGKKADGTVWCWGYGDYGQLNNGTSFNELSPVLLNSATNWKSIFAAAQATFVIDNNNTLWGCGENDNGSLGVGSPNQGIPALTQIGTNWKQVAGSGFHTIGLKTNNTLWS